MKQKQLSRRELLKLAAMMGGGVVIASCTPAAPTPTQAPPTAVPPTATPVADATYVEWISTVASTDPVEVRIVNWFDPNNPAEHNQALMDYATAEWKKRYPNGKINWELIGWGEIDQKTPGYVMANEPVDISYNWGGATANWCNADIVVPLDGLMPKWWYDTRNPAILKPPANDLCPDGKLVMATYGVENQLVVIRKDVLAAAGADPLSMTTYDGFIAGLKQMSKQKGFEKPFALKFGADYSSIDQVTFLWLANGRSFFDFQEDGSEKDAWLQSATFLKELCDLSPEGCLNWNWSEVEQAYATGQVAAIDHGNWYYGVGLNIDTEGKIINETTTGAIPYPYGPSSTVQKPFYSFSCTGFFMLKTSPEKNRKAVVDLLSIMGNSRTVWLHTDSDIPGTNDPETAARLKQAYNQAIGWWWKAWDDARQRSAALPYQGSIARDEITGVAFPLLVSYFRKELTPEALYSKTRELALPLLAEARKKQ